ncbi:UNVERIFIED_CONTAM: transcriptional regulator GlxA family with amidase domain [Streptomyces graminofaciens]
MSLFTATPAAPDDAVRALVEHIAAHPDDDLSTAALAARAGVTPHRLTRLFTEQLGRAPGRYVRQARTEAAAHVLASTTLPMAGVAARCGRGSSLRLRQRRDAAASVHGAVRDRPVRLPGGDAPGLRRPG